LASGVVYIAEPGAYLSLTSTLFCSMVADPEGIDRNSAVDLLFESVARYAGTQSIGIVLSGSRDDGARGLDAIHNAGGLTMVFTPADGRPPGMPENAVDYSGLVDVVGDTDKLASVINEALCPQLVSEH
jgi:two-component system chemotaxis response regulator CheB